MDRYLQFARSGENGIRREDFLFVIDTSISMEGTDYKPSRLAAACKATRALIDVKAANYPEDHVGIVTFSAAAKVVQDLVPVGKDADRLRSALRTIHSDHSTNMTAGLVQAEKLLFPGYIPTPFSSGDLANMFNKLIGISKPDVLQPEAHGIVRRIIFLTDGDHNHSKSPASVARRLKLAGVIIDCIGIGGSPADVDEKRLKAMASTNTDGTPRYCFIGEQEALIRKFEELGNHIRLV